MGAKIRVPLSGVLAKGHASNPLSSKEFDEDWQGIIVTLGRPIPPIAVMICDTDVVWPILDDHVISKSGKVIYITLGNRYVCRHQIEAGD